MSESLDTLENRRSALLDQIGQLGDFRPGSITTTSGRCGNPNCHCHLPGEPAHGPQLPADLPAPGQDRHRIVPHRRGPAQYTAPDRPVSQVATTEPRVGRCQHSHLSTPARRRHAHAAGQKTAETIQQEVAQEVDRLLQVIFSGWRTSGPFEFEAIESVTRAAMHRAAAVLSELLSSSEAAPPEAPRARGQQALYHDTRPKQLLTAVGAVEFQRAYYVCPHCRRGQCPRDSELDVAGTACSPGVRRMMALVVLRQNSVADRN